MYIQQIKCEDCGEVIVSNNSLELKRRYEEHKKEHQRRNQEIKK